MKLDALLSAACLALVAGSSAALTGCGDDGHRFRDRDGWATPSPEPTPASSAEPMLVEVDTGKTMTAAGGDGVGVFVEYAPGGKWRVSWTCDTNISKLPCQFDIQIGGKDSTLVNVARDDASDGKDITTKGVDDKTPSAAPTEYASAIFAVTRTTTDVRSVTFETLPGATVLVIAALAGQTSQQGGFMFFVQDGKVNGGYGGRITNALYFRGTTP